MIYLHITPNTEQLYSVIATSRFAKSLVVINLIGILVDICYSVLETVCSIFCEIETTLVSRPHSNVLGQQLDTNLHEALTTGVLITE